MASEYEEKYTEQEWISVLQDRLAAYEETRLTPEEIDMDHEAAEQLRQLCRDYDLGRLEELVKADKDGRLVVHGRWLTHYRSGVTVAEGFVSSCCDM